MVVKVTKHSTLEEYKGMSDIGSMNHQLKFWEKGISTHNPIRDECCPDFSCCEPNCLVVRAARTAFVEAHNIGDEELKSRMLLGFLGGLLAVSSSEAVHIIDPDAHDTKETH